jgi:hypothetical protein
VIKEKSQEVSAGKTYTEVVYPELEKIIDATLAPQYKPLAKAAGLSLLGAIDLMFAVNPEWKEDEALALDVVNSFILGAEQGFNLDENHPAMVQARRTAELRAKVRQ